MDQGIRIARVPYDDPSLCLDVVASDGVMGGRLEVYIDPAGLAEVAERLRATPGPEPVVVWEAGSPRPEDRWALHVRWTVVQLDAWGHAVLAVRLQVPGEVGHGRMVEAAIPVVASDLDRLAEALVAVAGGAGAVDWAPGR